MNKFLLSILASLVLCATDLSAASSPADEKGQSNETKEAQDDAAFLREQGEGTLQGKHRMLHLILQIRLTCMRFSVKAVKIA